MSIGARFLKKGSLIHGNRVKSLARLGWAIASRSRANNPKVEYFLNSRMNCVGSGPDLSQDGANKRANNYSGVLKRVRIPEHKFLRVSHYSQVQLTTLKWTYRYGRWMGVWCPKWLSVRSTTRSGVQKGVEDFVTEAACWVHFLKLAEVGCEYLTSISSR